MNNDLNQIRIFSQVAELNSFTKAAESLGLEKSTVSTKISQLESRLQIQLFHRTTRSVRLTDEGQQYLSYCRQALSALQDGDNYISELRQVPSGKLRVSTPYQLVEFFMDSVITPFLHQHPQVDLEIIQTSQTVNIIAEKYDIAICSLKDKIEDSSLIYRKLFSTQWILVASRNFINQYGRPKTLSELKQLPSIGIVSVNQEAPNSKLLYWRDQKVTLEHRFEVNNIMAIKQAMLNDLGIAMIPRGMVKAEIEQGRAEILLPDAQIPETTMYIIYPSRSGQPAKLKAFMQAILAWSETMK